MNKTCRRVDIRAPGELYFGTVIDGFEEPEITRFATAEYILPVPMGNPTSALGTGSDTQYGNQDNFWLRAMSDCESRQTGDFIGSASPACGASPPNPNHRPEGHSFVVDIPEGQGGMYRLQARLSCAEFGGDQANASMQFTLYPPDDTPLNDFDNDLAPPALGRRRRSIGPMGPSVPPTAVIGQRRQTRLPGSTSPVHR